ncbi:MAG: GNAT family N-acetyltransferase [Oscillochloris sp.]|nr:GNAT family N-acetyltransferase [Oscillochloris sp.]
MRILKKISDEFWWDVARKCSYATFYHTPIWKEVAARSYHGKQRDETFGAILLSGVHVVFPLISTRRIGPLRWLMSSFDGCYGGFIADGPVLPAEAVQLYKYACRWSTYSLYILDNPLGQLIPDTLKSTFNLIVEEPAFMVPLDADFETLFARFQRTQRKDYRRGLKRGVHVHLSTSIEDYRTYYYIYRDAVDRWGFDANYGYDWNRIEQIYQLSQIYPDHIKLWIMKVNEQVVGGTIVFYWGTQATAWSGTAHRDFLDYDVMPVGDTEMIHDALDQGYSYFDFNTCDQNQGVMEYKLRFGSPGVPISAWYYESPVITSVRSIIQRVRNTLHLFHSPKAGFDPIGQSAMTPPNVPEHNP